MLWEQISSGTTIDELRRASGQLMEAVTALAVYVLAILGSLEYLRLDWSPAQTIEHAKCWIPLGPHLTLAGFAAAVAQNFSITNPAEIVAEAEPCFATWTVEHRWAGIVYALSLLGGGGPPAETWYRLLEDGGKRAMEDSGFRLIEH
jgi:hypothetical protein